MARWPRPRRRICATTSCARTSLGGRSERADLESSPSRSRSTTTWRRAGLGSSCSIAAGGSSGAGVDSGATPPTSSGAAASTCCSAAGGMTGGSGSVSGTGWGSVASTGMRGLTGASGSTGAGCASTGSGLRGAINSAHCCLLLRRGLFEGRGRISSTAGDGVNGSTGQRLRWRAAPRAAWGPLLEARSRAARGAVGLLRREAR